MRRGPDRDHGRHSFDVAYLSDRYPLLTFGSAWREADSLRRRGVHVETFSLWTPSAAETAPGDERRRTFYLASAPWTSLLLAHVAGLVRWPRRYLGTLGLALRTRPPGAGGLAAGLSSFSWALLLAHRLRAARLRHVHSHGTGTSCTVAMLAASAGGLTFSVSVHGPRVFFEVAARHLGEKLHRAAFVRCISWFCRAQCMLWTPPEVWKRLHVLHCGVDPDAFAPRAHHGPGSHLLFVGRPGVRKGLPLLIEAVSALSSARPTLRLTVVGDGPERPAAVASAHAAGLHERVTFTGYQSPAQVAEWLAKADVLVLPSLAEGVPVVLMEAMAAGLPVVAANVAGVGELVEHGVSGFLVPPGDTQALVGPIGELLDDPELRGRMGRAGRETVVKNFALDRETAALHRLLAGAVGSDARDPALLQDPEPSPAP
jgi:glycosyltransferase involved in cell wall biosynthesis